jgi:hypothetical protein
MSRLPPALYREAARLHRQAERARKLGRAVMLTPRRADALARLLARAARMTETRPHC